MRALIQRVTHGEVKINNKTIGRIGSGYVILLGTMKGDSEKEVKLLTQKIVNLRIMKDGERKMNRSIVDTGGEVLVISQFTLYADVKGGRRPSFIKTQDPESANKLYLQFIEELKRLGIKNVQSGQFGAYMSILIENDGPVTIMLDSGEL